MILLDTHALLWWALDPDKLSQTAVRTLEDMEETGGFASSISIWELGIKVRQGKLDMGIGIDEFARRITLGGVVELVPVETTTWLRTIALPWDHRDPADRVIVATALLLDVPVLTKDQPMQDFEGIVTIW